DPRVDPERIGMVGVSFGGYWAARMAATDRRIRCAVACGAPTDRSFWPKLGLPEIILDALADVTGATTPVGLLRRLRRLSLRDRYREITQPLLVINGDNDTLLSTRDSIELAAGARHAELRLYPGDDHCAMANYRDWLDYSQQWIAGHLAVGD
ncbi:MAG: alpha/beta hydrolase family protein, partial [Baekduiaceae bacterium]